MNALIEIEMFADGGEKHGNRKLTCSQELIESPDQISATPNPFGELFYVTGEVDKSALNS